VNWSGGASSRLHLFGSERNKRPGRRAFRRLFDLLGRPNEARRIALGVVVRLVANGVKDTKRCGRETSPAQPVPYRKRTVLLHTCTKIKQTNKKTKRLSSFVWNSKNWVAGLNFPLKDIERGRVNMVKLSCNIGIFQFKKLKISIDILNFLEIWWRKVKNPTLTKKRNSTE